MPGFFPLVILLGLLYLLFAWSFPRAAIAFIFATAPFASLLLSGGGEEGGGALVALSEACLAGAFPVVFLRTVHRMKGTQINPVVGPIALYLFICLVSSIISWRGNDATISMLQMVLYLVVGLFVFSNFLRNNVQDYRYAFYGLLVSDVFLAVSVIALKSFYIFGLHKNGIGDALAAGTVISSELWLAERGRSFRRTLIAASFVIITAGLVSTFSRGSWVGALAGIFLLLAFRKRFSLILKLSITMVPVALTVWHFAPKKLQEYAFDVDSTRVNILARYQSIQFAKSQFEENMLYGAGVGLRKEYDATNVVMSTLAETGILGLIAFAWIHIALFRLLVRVRRRFSTESGIYTIAAIGFALVLNRLVHGMVDHYWTRGAMLIAWGGAGMLVAAYHCVTPTERQQDEHEAA